jgi:hypothetical protein
MPRNVNRFELDARDRKASGLAQVLDALALPQALLRRMTDAHWTAAVEVLRRSTGKNHSVPSALCRRRALAMVRLRRMHRRIEKAAGL